MLERFLPDPDPALVGFAQYLRDYPVPVSLSAILRLPWDLAATLSPGWLQGVLGIGVYGFLVGCKGSVESKILMCVSLLAFLLLLGLGQISPRFFLEPYLWVGAAVVGRSWNGRKLLLARLLPVQGVLTAALAGYLAYSQFPGALTERWRDEIMRETAYGYAEARWLDSVLPADAVIVTALPSRALLPRPFLVPDPAHYSAPSEVAERRLEELLRDGRATVIVADHPALEPRWRFLEPCLSLQRATVASFQTATRNPFNRGAAYERQVIPLDPNAPGCRLGRKPWAP